MTFGPRGKTFNLLINGAINLIDSVLSALLRFELAACRVLCSLG